MNYMDKLKDPRWQKKRLEIFNRDGWECKACEETVKTLCIHHISYVPGLDPWEYPDELLATLCCDCHEREKIERADYEKELLLILKEKGFSASCIQDLCEIFSELNVEWGQNHLISALYHINKQLQTAPFGALSIVPTK